MQALSIEMEVKYRIYVLFYQTKQDFIKQTQLQHNTHIYKNEFPT